MATSTTTGAQAHTESAAATTTEQTTSAATSTEQTSPKAGTPAAGAEPGKTGDTAAATSQADAAGKTTTDGTEGTHQERGGKADEHTAPSKVPDQYELRIPEGAEAYLEDADLARVKEIAKASGWSNEDAQAALEEHLAHVHAQSEAWKAQTLADTEYGGDHYEATRQLAQKAIDRIRPAGHARRESFLKFLGRGGAGNNLEVVSFLADLGRLMGEDAPVHAPSGGAGGSGDAASRMYDHPTSKALDGARG